MLSIGAAAEQQYCTVLANQTWSWPSEPSVELRMIFSPLSPFRLVPPPGLMITCGAPSVPDAAAAGGAVGIVRATEPSMLSAEVSRRYGSGRLDADFGMRFAPIDLVGLPVGLLSQLVLLRLVYWPLESWWPDTFSTPRLERSARTLYDSAEGGWLVVLVLIVVVGAPLIEELLYRGLLQGAFARRIDETIAVVAVAAWFAIIHFRPVEYPGLFVFGLVLGVCTLVTRRLGMSVLAHVAFNATGLVWVATR